MLSMYTQSPLPLADVYQPKVISEEMPDSLLRDSIETFADAIRLSRKSGTKLLCTIPTWGSSDDSPWDLADLQEQRSRILVLIHDLIKTLRSSGINASYSLTPSDSSRCIVCALPADAYLNQVVIAEVEKAQPSKRKGISVIEWSTGPCLVVH